MGSHTYETMSLDDLWDYVLNNPCNLDARDILMFRVSVEHEQEILLIRKKCNTGELASSAALHFLIDYELDLAFLSQAPDYEAAREILEYRKEDQPRSEHECNPGDTAV